jgi:hypothetical protein
LLPDIDKFKLAFASGKKNRHVHSSTKPFRSLGREEPKRPGGISTNRRLLPILRIDSTLSSNVWKKSKNIFAINVPEFLAACLAGCD